MQSNGWSAKTRDGSLSCQYEYGIVITKEGPMILTSQGEEGTHECFALAYTSYSNFK
ncbi:hypothetical protein IGJ55_001280 [Enterococcus sp. AZ170]